VHGAEPARALRARGGGRGGRAAGHERRGAERERGDGEERPPPAERDRDRGQRQARQQRAERRARLLRAERQPAAVHGDLPGQQLAHRRAAERVGDAADEQERGQSHRGLREGGDRQARERGGGRGDPDARGRADPLHQAPGRRRGERAHDVEDRDREADARVVEREVLRDPRREAGGQERRQDAGDHDPGAGDQRAPPARADRGHAAAGTPRMAWASARSSYA
jgi:hypothetical protein